ncbi:MAG: bifunctional 2-polyprenyl-6-hydroxyphenol methylase/3-demethylubiquinol 3-O-methyltransferase UbiG [Alphaproteobacteria bacterium]
MQSPDKNEKSTTIDPTEISHFSKDSPQWWDEDGPFKPLHRLNPVRMEYIKRTICNHYNKDFNDIQALQNLNILDIGCGGGLVCESLARMRANVTGIDADPHAIQAAKDHAIESDLDINYINDDAENIDEQFDVVLALEIIEHVSDVAAFITLCHKRLKPGGVLILSTLNRTVKSYALGIIGAEYILGWVPRGTHNWKKFMKPSEIASYARQKNLKPDNVTGLIFNPLKNTFALSDTDLDVNYLICFTDK